MSPAPPGRRMSEVRFFAGGTNLVDLFKENVERPTAVIDINRLPLAQISTRPDDGLRPGALASNADTAKHAEVKARYRLLASAILASASAQLRNAVTDGGKLNQRTRCYCFYHTATPCNKIKPGAGSDCIVTHPSDMCIAPKRSRPCRSAPTRMASCKRLSTTRQRQRRLHPGQRRHLHTGRHARARYRHRHDPV